MTSELRTKKGVSSFPRISSASLRGPAVPKGSVSTENAILILYWSSYCQNVSNGTPRALEPGLAYLLQDINHNFRSVVDSQDNVGNASSGQSLDLMQDHRLVPKFHQGLREGEGLGGVITGQRCFSGFAIS